MERCVISINVNAAAFLDSRTGNCLTSTRVFCQLQPLPSSWQCQLPWTFVITHTPFSPPPLCYTCIHAHFFITRFSPLSFSCDGPAESHPTAAPSPLSFYPQPPWLLPSLRCRLSQHTCYSSPSIPFNHSRFHIAGRVSMLLTSSFSNIRLVPTSSHLALRPLLFSNSHGLHHYLIKHSTDEDKGCHFHSPMGHLGNLPQVSRQASHPNSK